MNIPPRKSKTPLAHEHVTAIWKNCNYLNPKRKPAGWETYAPNSALGYLFEAEALFRIEKHKGDAVALKLIQRQHGRNFSALLPVDLRGPLSVSDYYRRGYLRILNAVNRRFEKGMEEFLKIHNQLQAFLMFKGFLEFNYPKYNLDEHPEFGSKFEQFFHQALVALTNWKDPWEKQESRERDKSPVRRNLIKAC